MMLAIYTGQRRGDLLSLPWSAYDGRVLKLKQKKTGAYVSIPVAEVLRRELDAAPRRCPIILTNSVGRPWSESGFQSAWGKATAESGHTRPDVSRSARNRRRDVGASGMQ